MGLGRPPGLPASRSGPPAEAISLTARGKSVVTGKTSSNSKGARRPLYQQAAEALAEVVARTPEGVRLPSEPALAHQLGVSRATLREAMRLFEERGLVVRRQGIGTYVTHPPQVIETGLEVLESMETLAARIGLAVEMGKLEVEERPASAEEAGLFALDPRETILQVSRVISTDGRPVAFLVDVLPRHVLSAADLRKGFRGSVLDLLLRRGDPPLDMSQTEVTALSAPADIARRLQVRRGDVLLHFEASLFTQAGQVIDRSASYFLPGFFRFRIVRRIGGAADTAARSNGNRRGSRSGAQPAPIV